MATTTRGAAKKAVGKAAGKAARKAAGGTTAVKKAATGAAKKSASGAKRASGGRSPARSATTAPSRASGASGARRALALPSLADLRKLAGRIQVPGVDVAAIVEAQRKDMQALADANRQAYDGMRALAARRGEILRQALADWQDAMKDVTGKDGLAKGTERAKQGVQQAIDRFRELAEMEAETRRKAWKVLQDRFQDNLAAVQKLLKPGA